MDRPYKILIISVSILIMFIFTSCESRDPIALETTFNENQTLFNQVREIINKKRIELKADYISINAKIDKNNGDKSRIFISFNMHSESNNIDNLTDIFSKDESDKIEKVFNNKKAKIIYIESAETYCNFSQKGLLDCYDEILYTTEPKEIEEYAAKDDDEIIKKLNGNWYIYGVR